MDVSFTPDKRVTGYRYHLTSPDINPVYVKIICFNLCKNKYE